MGRHVDRWMAGYLDNQLSPAESDRIGRHLRGCTRCQGRLREVAAGAELAARLDAVEPPAVTIARIEALLRTPPDPEMRSSPPSAWHLPGWSRLGLAGFWGSAWRLGRPRLGRPGSTGHLAPVSHWPRLVWSVAALAGVVAAFWFWPARVSFEPASAPPGSLEQIALAAFRRGGPPAGQDLETDSPEAARAWLRVRGLSAALATERRASFQLRGVTDVSRPGITAAAVRYAIDGQEAVLVTALASQVTDAPRWGVLGKRVRFQSTADGAKLLTWSNSGKAYTLVSRLGHRGEQACLICHTDARRQRLIARLAGQ
jgi:Putative zinc-finger